MTYNNKNIIINTINTIPNKYQYGLFGLEEVPVVHCHIRIIDINITATVTL